MSGFSQVSIVIPYHNEGELLTRALASVDEQTYAGPVEVVIVDDRSTVRPILNTGYGFETRVIRSENGLHAAGARNLGIQSAMADN